MDESPLPETPPHEWEPCHLSFPRIGFVATPFGVSRRLIMPGDYYVRRSRSLGRLVYRRRD